MARNRTIHCAFLCGLFAIVVLAFLMLSGLRRSPAPPNKAPINGSVQTAR